MEKVDRWWNKTRQKASSSQEDRRVASYITGDILGLCWWIPCPKLDSNDLNAAFQWV